LIGGQIELTGEESQHVVEVAVGATMAMHALCDGGSHGQHTAAPMVRMRVRVDFIGTPFLPAIDFVGSGGSPNVYADKNTIFENAEVKSRSSAVKFCKGATSFGLRANPV
jgi:hypothetical protein